MRLLKAFFGCLFVSQVYAQGPYDHFFPAGWYEAARLGLTLPPPTYAEGGGTRFDGRYGRDVSAQLALGYQQGHARYEIEMAYARNRARNISVGGTAQNPVFGGLDFTGTLLSVYYDFSSEGRTRSWTPYAGMGTGLANVRAHIDTALPNRVVGNRLKWAYHGTLGMAYRFNELLSLGLDYRYLGTDAAALRALNLASEPVDIQQSFRAHIVGVHAMYRFY